MSINKEPIAKAIAHDFESVLDYWSKIMGVAVERNRLLILLALLDSEIKKNDAPSQTIGTTNSLTFTQLVEKTKLEKNSLNYHLTILQKMGLIETRERRPYEITQEGKTVLESIGITEQLLQTFRQIPK